MTDLQLVESTQTSKLTLDSFSKLFALTITILYFIGFLVVASHLSRYGVSSFSVLQLQYLIAGIWVLGPPAVQATLTLISNRFDERAAPVAEGKFSWRRFAFSSLFTGIPSLLFIVLLVSIPTIVESMTWKIFGRLFLFYLVMVNCAQIFWMSWQADTKKETWWMNRSHAAPFYLALLLMIVMSYTLWFSVRIYPMIPFSLGGGRPLTVAFIEGEKKLPSEIKKADPGAKRSLPYELLLTSERSYVVRSPDPSEKSIEISRDSVAGMTVLK